MKTGLAEFLTKNNHQKIVFYCEQCSPNIPFDDVPVKKVSFMIGNAYFWCQFRVEKAFFGFEIHYRNIFVITRETYSYIKD